MWIVLLIAVCQDKKVLLLLLASLFADSGSMAVVAPCSHGDLHGLALRLAGHFQMAESFASFRRIMRYQAQARQYGSYHAQTGPHD